MNFQSELSPKTAILAMDFDETVAHTISETNVDGMDVNRAYEHAIYRLGKRNALEFYRMQNGHQNRAPQQIIRSFQEQPWFEGMLSEAAGFARSEMCTQLLKLGGGRPLNWKRDRGISALTELLVCCKLYELRNAIGSKCADGSPWPRLAPGFAEFSRSHNDRTDVRRVIISSGHRKFIESTFELHGLTLPDAMVTNDDCRHLEVPLEKPNQHLIRMALERLSYHGEARVTYIGDDPKNDGGLAQNANVSFVLMDPFGKYPDHPNRVGSWAEVCWPPATVEPAE